MTKEVSIALVGGGPGAVSTLAQLAEAVSEMSGVSIKAHVFEKTERIGPGLPYAFKDDSYILNLPKGVMEPVSGHEGRFSKWLEDNAPDCPKDTDFPPRHYFGDYLEYVYGRVKEQIKSADHPLKLVDHLRHEVVNVVSSKDGQYKIFSVDSTSDEATKPVEVNYVIFATGHLPSSNFTKLIGRPGYWHNPWDGKMSEELLADPSQPVTILGSRLTAIDVLLSLMNQGYEGPINFASRGGMLPSVLGKEIPPVPLKHLTLESFEKLTLGGVRPLLLDDVIELFRLEISDAEGHDIGLDHLVRSASDMSPRVRLNKEIEEASLGRRPWQQVLFASYPIIANIWYKLNDDDKLRFISEYRSLFMTYLAAFPLDNAHKVLEAMDSGQLRVLDGLESVNDASRDGFKLGFTGNRVLAVPHLVNATGPGTNSCDDPLYNKLLTNGFASKNAFGGLDVNPVHLTLNTPKGHHDNVFVIGENTQGACLSTTDMIRVALQAGRVVAGITDSLNAKLQVTNDQGWANFWEQSARHAEDTVTEIKYKLDPDLASPDRPKYKVVGDTVSATNMFLIAAPKRHLHHLPTGRVVGIADSLNAKLQVSSNQAWTNRGVQSASLIEAVTVRKAQNLHRFPARLRTFGSRKLPAKPSLSHCTAPVFPRVPHTNRLFAASRSFKGLGVRGGRCTGAAVAAATALCSCTFGSGY